MKTVAYYRNSISKEKQKLSIEMQMQHVHEVAAKNRLLIDDEFMDRETSARKKENGREKGHGAANRGNKKGARKKFNCVQPLPLGTKCTTVYEFI
ncbi:recombinase family protein [Geobacillus zalihae]|uniref:recombinase family protein n=1 Tax=Geobacillus zalihae TaxID=213419 RepID=UPI0021DF7EB4|nr:recombinase family protein [Geobacillus zalihae]